MDQPVSLYTITDAGQGILQTAVSNLLSQPRSLGSGFELGLANIHALKPHQVYRELRHHRDDLTYQLLQVESSWARRKGDGDDIAENITALYTHSIAMMKAQITWLENFIDEWEARYPDVEKTDKKRTDENPHAKVTRMGEPTTINRAKMLQKLKRPKLEPKDDTP